MISLKALALEQVVQESSLFQSIYELEHRRNQWLKRSIVTLDLSSGIDTYLEKLTHDILQSYVETVFDAQKSDMVYLPLYWRPRSAFLEFDCITNSGRSLQLMQRSFREEYSVWLFLRLCIEQGYLEEGEIFSWLHCLVLNGIHEGREDPTEIVACGDQEIAFWEGLMADEKLKRLYFYLCRYQLLIVKADCGDDFSILKVAERKSLQKPLRRMSERFFGRVSGEFEAPVGRCIRVIAPRDVRILDFYGISYRNLHQIHKNGAIIEGYLHGDGSWGFANLRADSRFIKWVVTFSPRRSYLLSQALRVSGLGSLAILFWFFVGINRSTPTQILQSFSMAAVGSVYLYHIGLLARSPDKSFQFNWASRFQRYLLIPVMALVPSFPFSAGILRYFGTRFNGIFNVQSSVNFNYFIFVVQIILMLFIILVTVYFLLVWRMNRPLVQTRR